MLVSEKDDSGWEMTSSVSSKSEKGYGRVMRRLLKQSKHLVMVVACQGLTYYSPVLLYQ